MKEEKIIHQIVKENDIHPTQVTDWKKALSENITGVFESGTRTGKKDFKRERPRLHSKIGELTVCVDCLEKNPNSSAYEAGLADRKNHRKLSVRKQCALLSVMRSMYYYNPTKQSEEERKIMGALDEIYMINPCMGSRPLVTKLSEDYGMGSNRK